jgi:iron(III) transport system permease protein
MAGASLALMELLADFGTVSIFNVDTFTTAIYKTWLGMFDLAVASQLASLLAGVVLLLLLMEKRARGRRRFAQGGQASAALGAYRIQLKSHQAWLASAWCALVWLAAFAVPVLQLLVWAWQSAAQDLDARYWAFVWHTVLLASLTAGLVVLAGLWLAYVQRLQPGRRVGAMVSVATMGYALPGMVLSIGLFIPIAWFDQQLADLAQVLGWATPVLLKGSMVVMLLALAARFMAVGFEPVQAVMQRITPHQEQAARGLGLGRWQVLRRLFVPLLRPGLFSALLLVFVEVMKEMPITLMTRPFGWDTLAVRVFEMTSEGMWERAALPSLCIVLVGLIPVVLLVKESESSR